MNNLIAVDPGNFKTKVVTATGVKAFDSGVYEIGSVTELDSHEMLVENSEHTHVVSIAGACYVVGHYATSMSRTKKLKKDKYTNEAYVRILTQVALFSLDTKQTKIRLATVNPIGATVKKVDIKERLLGAHTVIINSKTVAFNIEEVKVLNEGSIAVAAFQDEIDVDNFSIIDVGSSTINVADFNDFAYIHINSTTIPVGVETFRNKVDKTIDYKKLIEYIQEVIDEIIFIKQRVYVVTGDMTLFDRLELNEKLVYPSIYFNGQRVNTTFCNAIGAYYLLGAE